MRKRMDDRQICNEIGTYTVAQRVKNGAPHKTPQAAFSTFIHHYCPRLLQGVAGCCRSWAGCGKALAASPGQRQLILLVQVWLTAADGFFQCRHICRLALVAANQQAHNRSRAAPDYPGTDERRRDIVLIQRHGQWNARTDASSKLPSEMKAG